jgi:hypothetical protein
MVSLAFGFENMAVILFLWVKESLSRKPRGGLEWDITELKLSGD